VKEKLPLKWKWKQASVSKRVPGNRNTFPIPNNKNWKRKCVSVSKNKKWIKNSTVYP
jgi:hypothetical protein